MKVFLSYFGLFAILFSNLVESKRYDFFKHDDSLGKQEYYEHRGLQVYFFTPSFNSDVDKVVIGNQGVWTKEPGQNLTKVVGFFKCMGFGLSHVSYFTDEGESKELLLGYSHGDDDLVVVDKEKFYTKLVGYTNKTDKSNPEVPGHPVLHQLEYLLEQGVLNEKEPADKVREVLNRAKARAPEVAKEEVPVTEAPKEEVHAEL